MTSFMKVNLLKWERIISEYEQSDLTVAAYCFSKKISSGSFYNWRQKVKLLKSAESSGDFRKVVFNGEDPETDDKSVGLCIRFGQSVTIELDRNFNVSEFRKAAEVLLNLSC
jgi:hypothetical protein